VTTERPAVFVMDDHARERDASASLRLLDWTWQSFRRRPSSGTPTNPTRPHAANKQTAGERGTSEITIGVHRGQITRKMGARSLAELVRLADKLGVTPRKLPE
jgi:hypothetical protein